ncbi:hypothetical protein JRO89_XS11G0153300 [Xanthoceras sorbifolium]|uniref:RNase H type-1 domain-containing protein n=1 Tax=Xanthoceras sorbifolium TaxID=99658 RepID=A0ABQ8HFM8_9ROSI|nr:hypothetical protein JRO89_XS11G0153300 [Xanthoceras sorbifolium]
MLITELFGAKGPKTNKTVLGEIDTNSMLKYQVESGVEADDVERKGLDVVSNSSVTGPSSVVSCVPACVKDAVDGQSESGDEDGDVWLCPEEFLSDFERAALSYSFSPQEPISLLQCNLARWKTPPRASFKVNVDAAVDKGKNCIGIGIVIRDDIGAVILATSLVFYGCFDADIVEAKVVLEGLRLANDYGCFSLLVELDAFNVVNLCQVLIFSMNIDNWIVDI